MILFIHTKTDLPEKGIENTVQLLNDDCIISLAPRTIRSVESQGMILMSDTPDGKLTFIEPERDGINNGEQVS